MLYQILIFKGFSSQLSNSLTGIAISLFFSTVPFFIFYFDGLALDSDWWFWLFLVYLSVLFWSSGWASSYLEKKGKI